jgi:hypothetical protein
VRDWPQAQNRLAGTAISISGQGILWSGPPRSSSCTPSIAVSARPPIRVCVYLQERNRFPIRPPSPPGDFEILITNGGVVEKKKEARPC